MKIQLREIRKSLNITQSELANMSGLKPSHISFFESGSRLPSAKNLVKLATALQCQTDDILGFNVDEQAETVSIADYTVLRKGADVFIESKPINKMCMLRLRNILDRALRKA